MTFFHTETLKFTAPSYEQVKPFLVNMLWEILSFFKSGNNCNLSSWFMKAEIRKLILQRNSN